MKGNELIIVLDFGSQYTQLIARRVREINVYSEIHPYNIDINVLKDLKPKGIILSGGPASVYSGNAPLPSREIFNLQIPVLGICYGLQIITYFFGGSVKPSMEREYGKVEMFVDDSSSLFLGFEKKITVWMSHNDNVTQLPQGFKRLSHTPSSNYCAIENTEKQIYGVQFHPEVVHTERGIDIFKNFIYNICKCDATWHPENIIKEKINEVKEKVGNKKVICALSGGVDSSVLAVLMHHAIGDNLFCFHINNGLMREGESEYIVKRYIEDFKLNIDYIDATEIFLARLSGVIDPENKRRIIGNTFIELFEKEALKLGDVDYLAQGTLYPDVIESSSCDKPSARIKTHHNVGGLPEKMHLKLIEPFRELFKDEVRKIGKELNIPDEIINRHPFPGPGLAVRIIGEVNPEKLSILRKADAIFIDEIKKADLYNKIWQSFAVLLPVQTVGVMGDERTYENVIALRAVTSIDGMTADWFRMPNEILEKISNRIINEVKGVNRVVYDISSKPPATIEWE